ncbi:hypothetical protein C7460_10194 [Marinoscillum furvescens DSM 4134]|uniref:Uncharacterized protein n=2 Tax=Marinoscillum furvescens TaxID=1026 RepID=A0A3D9LG50_MARFU|nr:hypothetical protein C7460_10194 [Marinoscillum furvescens DSM 4134]
MITTMRKLVYFGGVFIAFLGIFMLLTKNELGYIPEALEISLLSLIFVIGVMLVVIISKRGLGG